MKLLLIGNTGQLGWELQRTLSPLGSLAAIDYPAINLAQPDSLRTLIRSQQPNVIVNATAYTAVDRAESEAERCMAINAQAPAVMAEEALRLGAALVHYSTDYVFDGAKGSPYVESDAPNPLGMYGRSKLAGEENVAAVGGSSIILRTSWVYSLRRDSFVTKVLAWSRQQPSLRVVTDQVSGPTWARMLAEVTAQFLAMGHADIAGWLGERRGLYHLSGSGWTSRLDWARAILEYDPNPEEQTTREMLPALTAEFLTPAQRPLFSALNCQRFGDTFGLRLPPWEDALRLAMQS